MKKIFILFLLISGFASAQIMVTPDGHPRFPKKGVADTIVATDTILISKVKGEVFGISYPDFIDGLPGIDWSTPVDSDITFDADGTYDIGSPTAGPEIIFYNQLFGLNGSNISLTDSTNEYRIDLLPTNGKIALTAYRKPASIWQIISQFEYDFVDGRWEIDDEEVAIDSNLMHLTGDESAIGQKDFSDVFMTVPKAAGIYIGGATRSENTKRWRQAKSTDDFVFALQNAANTSITGTYTDLYKLNSTGTPVNTTDLTPKAYVDAGTIGNNHFIKKNIRVATTANITLSGIQTIDGNLLTEGERVLVKNQTDAKQNGIYLASSGSWTRSPEASVSESLARMYVYVTAGNTMYDKFFLTSFDRSQSVGVDDVIFTEVPFNPSGTSMSDEEVKTAYENNANTNAFTDAEQTKLGYITVSGDVDLDAWLYEIALISGKIGSDTFGRTNATSIDDIYEQPYDDFISDGAPASGKLVILPNAPPITIETTATFDLSEKKVYNDQTADAGTITVSGLESAVELYIYIDRASAPTLEGATWDEMDGTLAFEANVPMILYGVVHPNKTTINYCYVKL